MTHVPLNFLTFFDDLFIGDELTLHKGRDFANWKIELLRVLPRQGKFPIPQNVWQAVFASIPDDWQGAVRFYCVTTREGMSQWRGSVKTGVAIDMRQGVVPCALTTS